jgi:siroheme synthase
MGLSNVVKIIDGLKRKLDIRLPAIAIHNGTLEDEKVVVSTLENLAQGMINSGIQSPAILIFGKHISNSLQYCDQFNESTLAIDRANI